MKRLLPALALGAMLAFPVTLAPPASADVPSPNGGLVTIKRKRS